VLTQATTGGGPITVRSGNSYWTIKGFHSLNAQYGGINLGEANPTTGIHDVVIENNVIETPVFLTGIGGVFMEAGCYNITVRNNTIIGTEAEGIYLGHFDYDHDSMTGTVVEGNTLIDTGVTEGDIDIKAPNFGAIVRYNTIYHTGSGRQVVAGIVVQASDVQVYGNAIYNLDAGAKDGDGIQVNGDQGSGIPGKILSNVLIYNNLIYGNQGNGISLHANNTMSPGSQIVNIKILNNTVISNSGQGLRANSSGGQTITIAELHNNIFSSNGLSAVALLTGTESIAAANNNLLFGSSPLAVYQGANKTWGQWQALGFDANGVNADPQLDGSYMPQAGSPVIGAASVQSEFTIDKNQVTRGASWDIGALERT
jgi:hypothetical protein